MAIKLCALELEMVTGSAYCEDDIYESNTNAPAFVAPELLLGGDGSIRNRCLFVWYIIVVCYD